MLRRRWDIRPVLSGRCFACFLDLENARPHERPVGASTLSQSHCRIGAKIEYSKEIRLYAKDHD